MFVVQRRDNSRCQWKTCSYKGKKCRYEYVSDARIAFRMQKQLMEDPRYPERQLRILDTETNGEVD